MNDAIYVGSGKKLGRYHEGALNVYVCLDDIPPEYIRIHEGKRYISFIIEEKRVPDCLGRTHTARVNTFKKDQDENILQ